MKKICIVYIRAGGGHVAAAEALKAVLENRDCQVEMLDIRTILNKIDPLYKLTGLKIEGLYDWQVKKGWNYNDFIQEKLLRISQWMIQRKYWSIWDELTNHFVLNRPDVVVSVFPNFNGVIEGACKYFSKPIPFYTVMTDMHDAYAPHFWSDAPRPALSFRDDYHSTMIVPTEKAYKESILHKPLNTIQVSGCIVHPKFYNHIEKLEFAPYSESNMQCFHEPVGLVMYGGNGSDRMIKIAESCENYYMPLIFICGKNEALYNKLTYIKYHGYIEERVEPWRIERFVTNVEWYMKQADYFIGKAGPGCISEALVSGLPVILDDHDGVMKQERYNIDWVIQNGFGDKLSELTSIDYISNSIGIFTREPYFSNMKQYIRNYNNKAVFEIADILLGE